MAGFQLRRALEAASCSPKADASGIRRTWPCGPDITSARAANGRRLTCRIENPVRSFWEGHVLCNLFCQAMISRMGLP